MKLYLLSQNQNAGHDTFDSCVVVARNATEAVKIHPEGANANRWGHPWSSWASSPDQVECEEIGTAKRGTKPGVIIASFNAG